ncbi:MAG: ATP-binding cassette domain-containing protein [Candidatus Izemoplasmatales bacterium]
MIRINHLTKRFAGADGDVAALDDVDFEIREGAVTGVIGMSGAGKSTLLRCIAGLAKPDAGAIEIDGKAVAGLDPLALRNLRQSLGVVFQGYNLLLQRTVAENVGFPLAILGWPKAKADARVAKLLDLVGLADKAKRHPATLSGGQMQRVAIARALAPSPRILLCDEPTSALDGITTRDVVALLSRINREQGVTVVVVTHEIGIVRALCDDVVVLDRGAVAESGPTGSVFTNPRAPITRLLLGEEVS